MLYPLFSTSFVCGLNIRLVKGVSHVLKDYIPVGE